MNMKAALGPNGRGKRFSGFTIVELLVSLGLVIFIMSLVSTIFVIATKSFRDMKAAGDLSEQLRSAGQLIRNMVKVKQKHFTGGVKPSDNPFWYPYNVSTGTPIVPTGTGPSAYYLASDVKNAGNTFGRNGYLRLDQKLPADPVGTDLDNLPVTTSDDRHDHRLSMTVLLESGERDLFSAYYPSDRPTFSPPAHPLNLVAHKYYEANNIVRRPNAEVAFFLAKQDLLDAPKTGLISGDAFPLPLYSLHMKTWLLREPSDLTEGLPPTVTDVGHPENRFYSLKTSSEWNDLAAMKDPLDRAAARWFNLNGPASRFGTAPLAPVSLAPLYPVSLDSLILRNVVSFEVQLLDSNCKSILIGRDEFYDSNAKANWDPDPLGGSWVARILVGSRITVGDLQNCKIFGIKIILRVYDPNNEITRQITIIEPL